MIDHDTLKAASWGNNAALDKVERAVIAFLTPLPATDLLTATALMRALADPEHFKLLGNALGHLRRRESFLECWQRSKVGRTRFKDASGNRLATIEYLGQGVAPRTIESVRADLDRCPPQAKARVALERELQSLLSAEVF